MEFHLNSILGGGRGRGKEDNDETLHEKFHKVCTCVIFFHLYYLPCRYPPFYDENPFGIYEKILEGKIDWPRHLTADSRYECIHSDCTREGGG